MPKKPPDDATLAQAGKHVDWDSVEREYIYGLIIEKKKGEFHRHYPSFRELGRRLKINSSTVGYYARTRNWADRREAFRLHLRREFDLEVAKARALSAADSLAILDTYIRRFGAAVEADAVARSSIKDLDVALRAKAFVQKEVDRSDDATATLNLAQLQARHAKQRAVAEAVTGDEVGFTPSRLDREALAAMPEGALPSGAPPPDGGSGGTGPAGPGGVGPVVPAVPATAAHTAATAGRPPANWPTVHQAGGLWFRAARAVDRAIEAALAGGWDPDTLAPSPPEAWAEGLKRKSAAKPPGRPRKPGPKRGRKPKQPGRGAAQKRARAAAAAAAAAGSAAGDSPQ